ncbi:TonB family protein [Thermodesulfatator indicus DSM 15286]|uniref:TonB family protein n=1 Tax=Thermodesulfatator indicus (strain DSM 15286 / JCM 11887 / CIR29812) TaxID=667014 RepID=F8AE61_THEID|nr:energy transducer TonB [Thermodesulfatator indicus]AEH44251.1 TonB family protein [Thermodesulfatator indicus DSM 15286]
MNNQLWFKAILFSLILHAFFFTGLILANRPTPKKAEVIRINLKTLSFEPPARKATPKEVKKETKKTIPKAPTQKIKRVKKVSTKKTVSKAGKKPVTKGTGKKKIGKKKKGTGEIATSEERLLAQRLAALKAKVEEEELEKKLEEKLAALKNKETQGGLSLGSGLSQELTKRLAAHIMSYWAVPKILEDKPYLSAEVELEIAPNGKIISWRFIKRSGEPLFDEAVVATLKKADPLPAPGKYLKLPAVFKMK